MRRLVPIALRILQAKKIKRLYVGEHRNVMDVDDDNWEYDWDHSWDKDDLRIIVGSNTLHDWQESEQFMSLKNDGLYF